MGGRGGRKRRGEEWDSADERKGRVNEGREGTPPGFYLQPPHPSDEVLD